MDIDAEPANDEHPEANGEDNNQSSPFCSASIERCSICQGRGPALLPDHWLHSFAGYLKLSYPCGMGILRERLKSTRNAGPEGIFG
jgi:hypothetical protein